MSKFVVPHHMGICCARECHNRVANLRQLQTINLLLLVCSEHNHHEVFRPTGGDASADTKETVCVARQTGRAVVSVRTSKNLQYKVCYLWSLSWRCTVNSIHLHIYIRSLRNYGILILKVELWICTCIHWLWEGVIAGCSNWLLSNRQQITCISQMEQYLSSSGRGIASNEAEEAVASSLFCVRTRASIGGVLA